MDIYMGATRGGTRRKHTDEFRAEVLAQCRRPGKSIAGVALEHGLNANLVRTWLRNSALSGNACAEVATLEAPAAEFPSFIPLPLSVTQPDTVQVIQVEVRKDALKMTVTWPISAVSDFAHWSTAILK